MGGTSLKHDDNTSVKRDVQHPHHISLADLYSSSVALPMALYKYVL